MGTGLELLDTTVLATKLRPGQYGAPPTDTRPRRWVKRVKDPLTSKDDFIWNKDWRPFVDRKPKLAPEPQLEEKSGFVCLNRAMELDRLDVDLSKELAVNLKQTIAEQPDIHMPVRSKKRWRYAPTRREQKRWESGRKAMEAISSDSRNSVQRSQAGWETYNQLKDKLQLLTMIFGGAGLTCSFLLYSSDVTLSYGVGLIGAFVYVRMLGSSTDSLGGGIGQPRLLVPVALTMTYNRWNELLVPHYGIASLQLIPILAGFFTYKIATVAQVVQDTFFQDANERP